MNQPASNQSAVPPSAPLWNAADADSRALGPRELGAAHLDDDRIKDRIVEDLGRARARTGVLTEALDDAELVRQHSRLMSPLVWDLAHIGNQEELWLLRDVGGREPILPETVDQLYDAFQHPRADRPALPLLDPASSRKYVGEVRTKVIDLLERTPLHGTRLTEGGFVFGMIAQHEQQHAETMLATHQLRVGDPVLSAPPPPLPAAGRLPAEVLVPGGPFTMGTSVHPWALDNERPAHQVDVDAFWLDTVPVSNADYQDFIADGGYQQRRWWDPAGWRHVQSAGLCGAAVLAAGGPGLAAPQVRSARADPGGRAGDARLLVRGRRLRPLGRQTAAHRDRVGEGCPARSGLRNQSAVPMGRRRRRPRSGRISVRTICNPRRSVPTRPEPRRWASISSSVTSGNGPPATSPAIRASPRGRIGSTPRCSSVPTTRCCAADRLPPTGWPAAARSATGTTRSAGRSSPGSAALGTPLPGRAEPCAVIWPMSVRRCCWALCSPTRRFRWSASRGRRAASSTGWSTRTASESVGTSTVSPSRPGIEAPVRSGRTRRSPTWCG